MLIKMVREDALKMGLLNCKHCKLPPNNHFDFGEKKCAHNKACPGYEEVSRIGQLVEEHTASDEMQQMMAAWNQWKVQFEKGVLGHYDALLTLTQAQGEFIRNPSAVRWNAVRDAMFIYQQVLKGPK